LIIGNCQLSDRIIHASEIGQYDFCAKAWWLGSIEGVPPSNIQQLQAGTAAHEEHGRQVRRASQLQVVAFTLMGLGVIILLLALFVR
jgi:CRISPR/Cas system-associated exonuclease Cas4 (RecB family)